MVMLGKSYFPGTISYFDRAGTEYKHFRLEDQDWSYLINLTSRDEMCKINKEFIDSAIAKGDQFFLSHDPYNPSIRTDFYKDELDYIEFTLHGRIEKVNENLWKVNFN